MRDIIPKTLPFLLLASLMILVLLIVAMASVPPVSRDALTHHLAVPRLYLEHGGIYETPDIIAAYNPMNLDLLYVLPLLWANDIAPKYIHFLFALATGVLIYGHLRRRLSPSYGMIAVLLFLSLPVIIKLSITVYVDLGLVFFSTAALLGLVKWKESNWQTRYLLLAALCCGLALGTKYNGLVVLMLMSFFVPLIRISRTDEPGNDPELPPALRAAILSGVLFTTLALIVYAPWGLRNLLWTGNPFFPLFDAVFNAQDPYVESKLHPFAIRKLLYGESLWEILGVPLRIFWQGQDDVPALFDGRLNPGLLLLPLGLLLAKPKGTARRFELKLWLSFASLFILIVFFSRDMRIRYMAPALPPLIILSTYGLSALFDRCRRVRATARRRACRIAIMAGLSGIFALNGFYAAKLFAQVAPLPYIRGEVSRSAYIEKYRPEYAAIQFANQHLQTGDRVLCIFLGNRRYYLRRPNLFLEWSRFKPLVEQARHPEALADTLRTRGITHVLVSVRMMETWAARTMQAADRARLKAFWSDYLEKQFEKGGYSVYRLKGPPSSARG